MKAKQIEWCDKYQALGDVVGKIGNQYLYTIDRFETEDSIWWVAEQQLNDGYEVVAERVALYECKQACQDHLQQYVQLLKEQADGLYCQLQQLTEE